MFFVVPISFGTAAALVILRETFRRGWRGVLAQLMGITASFGLLLCLCTIIYTNNTTYTGEQPFANWTILFFVAVWASIFFPAVSLWNSASESRLPPRVRGRYWQGMSYRGTLR